jgi:hypothetical protein
MALPKRDPARVALAAVIAEVAVAQKNLSDARAAHRKAWEHISAARQRLDALKEEEKEIPEGLPHDLIVALAAGADIDTLESPAVERSFANPVRWIVFLRVLMLRMMSLWRGGCN